MAESIVVSADRLGRADSLAQQIGEQIHRGILPPGSKLLPTTKLAKAYGVSPRTAHRAVSELARRGLVLQHVGRGSFVREDLQVPPAPDRPLVADVLLMLRCRGDLWSDFSASLLRGLAGMNCRPVVLDTTDLRPDTCAGLRVFQDIIARPPAIVVIDDAAFQALLRDQLPTSQVVCVSPHPASAPTCHQAIPDFREGGMLAGDYLLAAGYRRIACVHLLAAYHGKDVLPVIDRELLAGFEQALAAAGRTPTAMIGLSTRSRDLPQPDRLRDLLTGPDRPDAVFCTYTHRAVELVDVARSMGLGVPADLAVLSVWNTPWAEAYGLTVLNCDYSAVAEQCLRMLADLLAHPADPGHYRVCAVTPRIVVRNSCPPQTDEPT